MRQRQPRATRALAAACVASTLWIANPAPARAQANAQGPSFPAGTELVVVDVLVLDKDGRPVQGLTQADFAIKEDGQPQRATSFEAVAISESPRSEVATQVRVSTNALPPPRAEQSFMIVFDDANISPLTVKRAREAVLDFVRAGLRDGDEVTLVPTSGGAWWTARLPQGREQLGSFLERLEGKRRLDAGGARIGDYEAMQIVLQRDPQILAHVARRYYNNGIIADLPPPPDRDTGRRQLDVSPGLLLIKAKAQEVYVLAKERLRRSLDVLTRVAQSLDALRGRKSVLLVSEGFVFDTTISEYRDFLRAARSANAAFYFVDARGLEGALGAGGLPGGGAEQGRDVDERDTLGTLVSASREADGARSAAADTGGFSITNTNELAKGMRRIAEEARSYYLLGYVSQNTRRDGKYRRIEVKVARPDVDVRARRGYYAPASEGVQTPPPGELDPRVRAALDSPWGASTLPLRLTSYVLAPSADEKKATVLLAAELDLAGLGLVRGADGRFGGAFETFLVVGSLSNGENFHQEKVLELSLPPEVHARLERSGLPVYRDLTLPPGAYQARFLVRQRGGARMGSVRHDFVVPDPQGLRTSTPILTDSLQGDQTGAAPRPIPLARREFTAGSRLFYAFDVYGAERAMPAGAPRVSTGYLVRRADGTALARSEVKPLQTGPQGTLSQMLGISLESATPGDYEVVLTVHDEVAGKTLEVRDPFQVRAATAAR